MTPRDDFYVGYQERMPAALRRFLQPVVVFLVLLGVGLAVALVTLQGRFDPGTFEFGTVREFEGMLVESPYPMLMVEPPVAVGNESDSRFLLVAFGKNGAADQVAGLDGRRVRLSGSLIYREGEAMIELASDGIEPVDGEAMPLAEPVSLGSWTLRGEIVDSKCFLGVMKPGRGKPHRACATRCLSGGIPPVLRVETADGDFRHFLLVDAAGEAVNERILDLVAEPVEVTGEVTRRGDLLVLATDPAGIRRL